MEEKNKYLQFAKINDSVTELYVYGDIRKPDFFERLFGDEGDGRVDALSFKDRLAQVDTPNLLVRINSMGGEVAEGLAIYSLLSDFKGHLITQIDGFACSAASVIFMAGEERIMTESSLIMIHNAWCNAQGDHNQLRKTADDLETITQPSVNIYVSKTGLSESDVKSMMNDETWMDYHKAFELGFATKIQKENDAEQSVQDLNSYIRKLVKENIELKSEVNKYSVLGENKTIKEEKKDPWDAFFNSGN